ncbi:MAG TPA: glutathione S-transferase family protein [Burkholderiales bacterium]|nr:glutathione S-transferase family protein [Burkholderiales bacterium]
MIELYAAGTSNGIRARIGLEECGLAYRLRPVDLAKGENRTPAFLALNPNAQIPVIVDPEGPGGRAVTLSQSTAILLYCAEKSGRFLPRDSAERPLFLQALMSASTDITPTLGTVFQILRSKDPHMPTADMFKARTRAYFQVWDEQLASRPYAAGEALTVADFSLFAGYKRAMDVVPETCAGMKALERWATRIAERPAVQRALSF